METRALLTHDEFVKLATTPEDDGWVTGRFIIFHPEIDVIDGWRNWDSPTNRQLTEAQRALYALSSAIYYSHRSGGVVDWFEEEHSSWGEILRLLSSVHWPEFSRRFERALYGQAGTGGTPDAAMKAWNKRRKQEYEAMLTQARRILRRRTGKEIKVEEIDLCNYAMIFASQGEMSLPERVCPAAREFGDWVRLGSAKSESVMRVSTWLLANEGGLRRST